ncbi:carbohydrate binding domain-containing protein [Cohnella sp. WQ 127256]|uniref:carbohydrate binding domain-containing protein n=1 Tax=Cohnella sp. WQ 127256 TaxID=2938790 RepID=UPI0021190C05|nr:carbohydrate binding domain-containing protein [Cohnella sp. WQ 127256]
MRMIPTPRHFSKMTAFILILQLIIASVSFPMGAWAEENDQASLASVNPNLVQNPGFEYDLSGWDVSFPDSVVEATYDAHSGSKAIRVKQSSQEQTVPIEPEKSYKLTFWAKTGGPAEQNVVGMNFWDVPGVGLQGARVAVDSNVYKKYEIYFTAPIGFSSSTIVIWKEPGAGWVYVDDVELVELANQVVNPGFEEGLAGWDLTWPDTVEQLTSDSATGSQALMVNASSREQTVNIDSGKSYKLTFKGKRVGPAELNVVGINFWDVPGLGLQGSRVTVDSSAYNDYTLYFTAPAGFSKATVVIWKEPGTGWVAVDDFTITEWSAQGTVEIPKRTARTVLNEPSKKQPHLLLMEHPGAGTTWPAKVKENIEHIESLPFDGITITPTFSSKLMSRESVSYETMMEELKVLKGLFKKVNKNYLEVFSNRPSDPADTTGRTGDLFDDEGWAVVESNMKNFARAAKKVGIKRILYDNEEYFGRFTNYPQTSFYTEKSLQEYQDKARDRGRQMMNAIISEMPEASVLVLHGPYITDPNKPDWFVKNVVGTVNLMGPFFIGMMQAADASGNHAKVIDGGELYLMRSQGDFEDAYQFRKYELADAYSNNAFIPEDLRSKYAQNSNLAFGVYNEHWMANYPMDPTIMRDTLENALRSADEVVWYYNEPAGSGDWMIPGSVSSVWFDAVNGAKKAVDDLKTGTNRIYNGGFEFDDVNWERFGSAEVKHVLGSTLVANSDANALVLSPDLGGAQQTITSELNKESIYQLSAWSKSMAPGDYAEIGIVLKDGIGEVVGQYSFNMNDTTYRKGSVSFLVPSNYSSAQVYAKREVGSDSIFVDDVVLRELFDVPTRLVLSANKTEVKVNQKVKLDVKVLNGKGKKVRVDDGAITYLSSNPSVATVNTEGKVTIQGIGNTTITASSILNGLSLSDQLEIKVKAKGKAHNDEDNE